MSLYGQFCPISRAAEVLGERWTLLIIREMLVGSSRFNQLQRGLGKISPSLLTKRLQDLEAHRLIRRQKIPGQKGFEYFLTPSGKSLEPLVMELGRWGINWLEEPLSDEELDLEHLMLDIQRSVDPALLPERTTTLKLHFSDACELPDWWLMFSRDGVDLCTKDPGAEPDVWLTTQMRTLIGVYMGDQSWQNALRDDQIKLLGDAVIAKQVPAWIGTSILVGLKQTG